MKLEKFLKTLDEDQIISIGAQNGANYLYIGRAGDVELIGEMFSQYRYRSVSRLAYLEKTLKELVKEVPKKGKDQAETDRLIEGYAKNVTSTYLGIEKHRTYLSKYSDPLKREVVETENRDCEEGIRVIIKGSEKGKYWFKSEFDERKD